MEEMLRHSSGTPESLTTAVEAKTARLSTTSNRENGMTPCVTGKSVLSVRLYLMSKQTVLIALIDCGGRSE